MCVNKYKCIFCKTSTPPSRHQRPEKQNKNTCTLTYSVTIRKRRSKLSTGELITTAKDPRKRTATIPVIYAEHKQTKCYAVRERKPREPIKIKAVVFVNEKSYKRWGAERGIRVCANIQKVNKCSNKLKFLTERLSPTH